MANNSNHIISRYGKWITNKQKERLRKLYKGYRQSTAGDMRSQYLNARKGMYGVRTTASAYGLGEGYVARKKAQMDSSLAEAGRQYAAQADAAFENNAVRPAANATIQAENERKQREYEEKLRKAREKAARQAKAQADYEKALEEHNRNKDKTDKENAKRLAEYKKAMAKYRKDLKNAKQRGEKLDRLPQRQILHGGQPLPKGLSLSADLHQYEGATSTPKPLKPLPKGKGKGKGTGNGRGGLLSTDMYEYESGAGHQPTATSHQGLNNRPVAPKTNYAANQTAIQNRKKAREAVVGKPTKPILAIDNTPIPVPPHVEKDLIAKAEAMKPEEIPQLKNDYINSAVEHENLVGDLYNALKPDMNRVSLAQEFSHWVGVAQNTALSPAERKQAAMYASRAAEEYNLQDNGKAHKEQIATLTQMVNDSHEQLIQQQFLLQQKGVRMSEDEIGFDTGYLRQYGAIPAQASDATYAQAQALGDKNSDLGKQLRELTKMEYLHSQGLPSGQLSPQMQAFIEENNLGWLIDQEVLDRAPLVGIEAAIEEKLKRGGDERTEYLQRKGIDRVQRELSTSNPEAIKRIVGDGDGVTHLKDALERGGDAFDKGNTTMMERVESYIQNNLGVPSDYINKNTINALRKDEASVAFIDYCYATGQEDLAKQFLFDLTEAANKAAGEKQADKISNLLPDGWKWIPEFMYHLGYGASNAIWGKIDFFRGKTPTRTGAYTQEGIIQNEIERGWSEGKARNWANALTSAGENFTDLAIGTLTGNALGAAGDAIGGTVGNIVGKVAGHAPGISMGWSAAGSAKQEMLKKGYSEKAATIYGIFSGVSEAVLQEKVGGLVGFGDRGAFTKALSGLVNQIPNAAGRTAINAVLDVASEIGQEEFGNILDSVYKSVVLGEGNDVYADFKEQFNETAVTTAISTLLLNALHIPTQIRNERGYSAIADASGMSLNDAKFLLETDAAINGGERVDPNDILRYNELTANLMASMPDNVVKAIADGKMTVADWVTSAEGVTQGKLMGKLSASERTAVQTEAVDHTEKLKGKTDEQKRDYLLTAAPTGKVGSAYYTTTDGKKLEFRNLNTTQKANYVLAQKCAKAFEGSVDVVIHDTLPLSNGAMVGSDGKLHIALDTTNEQGRESIAYWTLAHEAGHALKIADGEAWNEMFGILTDYAKNHKDRDGKSLYDALVDSITNQYKYDNNSDAFNDEMFSLIAERMVGSEGEQWAATLGDNTIFDAIANDRNASAKAKKGFLGKLKASVEKLSRQLRDGGFSKERKRLAKIREQLTGAYKRINEGETVKEKYAEEKGKKKTSEKVSAAEVGVNIDGASESANPTMMSLRTWNNSEYVKQRDKTAEEMAKELSISIEKAKDYIDNVNSIAKMIAEDQTRLDYEAAEGLSPFVSNAEYGGSLDFSTICKKRRLMTGTISAIQKALRNSTLTRDEILDIRNMMKERGYEVSCGLCYVEGSRAKMGEFCAEFIKLFKKHNPNAEWVPDMYDVNTPDGAERMRVEHPDVYKQYEYFWNHYGTLQKGDPNLFASQQKPKLFQKSTEYTDEILVKFRKSAKNGKVAEKNKNGGLRLQSFSDFEIIHLLDAMQAITDMSRVGLAGQAYTKVPDFAWALGDTGVKINLSLISKGVDENGHIILDEVEGMPRKDAEALRNRYSDNVGTILVVFNDEQLKAAMADDFIDFIIPFHVSQWNSNLYEAMGLPKGTKDYTQYQNEHFIKKTFHEHNGKMVADKATNFMPNEYWDFDKTGKENAEAYLKLCAENNKVPKFSNLLVDNGDGSWSLQPDGSTDGYWKLLIDFKMYNNDGKGVPQMPVQPNFNMEEAQRMLNEYKGGHENFPVAQDVVDDFIKNRDEPATRHSLRATDAEYLSLAEKYRDGTASAEDINVLNKAVEEAAKANGYKKKVYHGTRGERFNIFDFSKDQRGNRQMFFSSNRKIAETYGHRVMSLFINTDNFLTVDANGDWWTGFEDKITKDKAQAVLDQTKAALQSAYYDANDRLSHAEYGSEEYIKASREASEAWDKWNEMRGQLEPFDDEYISGTTYSVANKAREMGYAGLIIKRVVDTADTSVDMPSTVYVIFDSNRVKSADPVTYADNGDIIPLSERFRTDREGNEAWKNEDIRYQKRIKAEDKRDAGEKLTESQFYSVYSAHKLDLRGKGNIEEQIKNIKEEGFKGYGGFGNNIMPTRQFTSYPTIDKYNALLELEKKGGLEPGYAEKYKAELGDEYGKPVPSNLSEKAYGPRKGEWVMLVPRSGVEHYARGAERVLPGYKPAFDYEFVQVDYDFQPYYEMYSKAYDRYAAQNDNIRYQQRDFRVDFNVPQLDTKALHEAVKDGEGTVENRFEVKYEKTDSGFAVHITDKDSGKTYDRAETVTEGNAQAEAERAAAAVIRNIKRGKPDSKSKSTAGIYIEKGEIPARDVNIPVSVKEGMRTSKLARTIAEASGMTEESVDELMDRVYDGFMSYKPDVNQESMDKALAKVEDDMAGAVTEWNEVVNKGKILSPDDVALGSALMVSASQSGNINEAMEIAAQLQDLATTGGKLVQSFRMIKRLGAAGAFYYINRQVAKINAELKKAAKGYEIELNQDLVNQLLAATDYHDIRDITEEIRKDLGHQLKPTLTDWLTAWRYTAMLGNLRTLDRNLLGNAGFIPIVMVKNMVNVGLQGAAKVLSGGKFQKTARLFASKQYTDFAKWDWNDQVKYDIKGNKYNDEANEIKQYMRYDTGAKGVLKIPAKVFNAWRSATTHAMEDERLLGDMAFKKAHYDYTLATRLQQQKVDTEMLKDVLARSRNGAVFKADSEEARLLDIYNKASEYAQQEANRNTYNDINAFARFISQMSKRAKESNNKVVRAAHYAIEGILPFKNTPANIISRAVEYSPIGIARTIAFDIGRLAKGRISGEQFIENLAKGITGSGLFALGAILAKSGILRGALGYDDDEDKDLKRKGHQSYSIEIFDKSITLDWLAPECIPLFMGVEFFNQMGDMSVDVWNEKGLKALLNVTTGAFEPMLNMSMLQGVNALFEGFKSKDDLAGLSKAFATIGTSYLTQFEPTLFGQFARTLDPYRRSTYIDKNSKLPPFISKFWQTAIKKIPGATDTLLPYVNEWGEKEKTPQWWVRALENFLSPAYINDLTETDVDREISRLFEATAETGAFPDSANKYVSYNGERYDLTQKEYEQYAVMRGETAYALAQEMISTQWYNGLSDVEKAAAFADAYAYADTIASSAILDGRLGANAPDLETLAKNKNRSWVSKANVFAKTMGTPDALSQFIALRQTMAGMTGGRDARAEYLNGINELSNEAKALLMGMYDTSEGYADGTAFYNKNGKLVIDFANPGEAAPAEQATTSSEDATAPAAVPAPTATPAAQPAAEATAKPKSDKYTKAAEKWSPYGVTASQAKTAVEKWEQTGNASEYRAWLSKQNYTGRQKFAMYAQANADTEKKAVDFNKKYGTKFEALWDAYAKYDSNSFHGEDYRAWVEKQTNDYRQRFSLVEFAEPRSNWIEHAEELHKAGVSYKAVWEAARYAKNQSGRGKKDRIIAYAKKLGMTSKQAENIYKWFG